MDMDIFPRTRGRAAKPLNVEVARELEAADLELLATEKGSEAPALKRLSERHHGLARQLASGTDHIQAGIICGYSGSRISILLDDPAFKELVEFYRADLQEVGRDLAARMSGLALTAADELADRLEDTPENFSIGQLQEVIKLGADRTGFGPQTSSTNVNINVDLASRLEAARLRVKSRPSSQIIEG